MRFTVSATDTVPAVLGLAAETQANSDPGPKPDQS